MNYRVLPGKEDLFEATFARIVEALAKEPGHTASHLYRDVRDPQRYLILSDWNDRVAFDAFVKSDRFAKVTTWGKEQVLAERPRHEVYER